MSQAALAVAISIGIVSIAIVVRFTLRQSQTWKIARFLGIIIQTLVFPDREN